jgi:hypothetical protein
MKADRNLLLCSFSCPLTVHIFLHFSWLVQDPQDYLIYYLCFCGFDLPLVFPSGTVLVGIVPQTEYKMPGGRPRNQWTASKKRQLVRLYTLTRLEVKKIQLLLEENGFNPW